MLVFLSLKLAARKDGRRAKAAKRHASAACGFKPRRAPYPDGSRGDLSIFDWQLGKTGWRRGKTRAGAVRRRADRRGCKSSPPHILTMGGLMEHGNIEAERRLRALMRRCGGDEDGDGEYMEAEDDDLWLTLPDGTEVRCDVVMRFYPLGTVRRDELEFDAGECAELTGIELTGAQLAEVERIMVALFLSCADYARRVL